MCSRDCKKTGLTALAVFILLTILEFLVHEVLLKSTYRLPGYMKLWNPPEVFKARMVWMYLGNALFSMAFAVVYDKGYEESKPPLGQGLRYGFWIGLIAPVQIAIHNYFVYPVSFKLAGAWAALGLIECVLLGVVAAGIYRPHQH